MIENLGSPSVVFDHFGKLSLFPDAAPAAQHPSPDGARPASGRLANRSLAGLTLLAPALLCLGLATPAEALVIDVTYDASVTSLGNAGAVTTADIESAYNAVASAFDSAITNNVTVAIGVGWGEANNYSIPAGDISSSRDAITGGYSYSSLEAKLGGLGVTLPSVSPAGSLSYYIPDAEALALGISVTPASSQSSNCHCDGYIGFDSAADFSFPGTASVTAGSYSFTAAAEHETEEVLGRTSGLTSAGPIYATPLDVYRCTAGAPSFIYTAAAYASTNDCATDLGTLNTPSNGGDAGDWAVPNPDTNTDAQNAAEATGLVEGLSISDEDVLEGLGWTFASNTLFNGANAPIGASPGVNNPLSAPEPAGLATLLVGVGAIRLVVRRRRHPV